MRSLDIHRGRYNYKLVNYVRVDIKVKIICRKHGVFEQVPNSHLQGVGCPHCGTEAMVNKRVRPVRDFIDLANNKHNHSYDYSLVEYINSQTKVKIICKIHGVFEQKPNNHLRGNGCPSCANLVMGNKLRSNAETFINRANTVHNNQYDYSKVKYENARSSIIITCPEHGDFKQSPDNHLKGVGCPCCANYGFDRSRPASLYVLRSNCGRYMKIGITHNPKQRHNKLKRDTPFSFKRIELIEGSGAQVAKVEKQLLDATEPVMFTGTFDGYSEWRLWDDSIRHKLISFMDKDSSHGPV